MAAIINVKGEPIKVQMIAATLMSLISCRLRNHIIVKATNVANEIMKL